MLLEAMDLTSWFPTWLEAMDWSSWSPILWGGHGVEQEASHGVASQCYGPLVGFQGQRKLSLELQREPPAQPGLIQLGSEVDGLGTGVQSQVEPGLLALAIAVNLLTAGPGVHRQGQGLQ